MRDRLPDAIAAGTVFVWEDEGSPRAMAAQEAFLRFGRGRHQAALSLGDCFSYAAAAVENEPLLFKGDDFAHTDMATVPC